MKNNIIMKNKKDLIRYFCSECDFFTNNRYNYEKHIITEKHDLILTDQHLQDACHITDLYFFSLFKWCVVVKILNPDHSIVNICDFSTYTSM